MHKDILQKRLNPVGLGRGRVEPAGGKPQVVLGGRGRRCRRCSCIFRRDRLLLCTFRTLREGGALRGETRYRKRRFYRYTSQSVNTLRHFKSTCVCNLPLLRWNGIFLPTFGKVNVCKAEAAFLAAASEPCPLSLSLSHRQRFFYG